MLILTRREGEALVIGDDVEITVLEVSGEHVRIGISAPKDVPVVRRELREAVARENRLATSALAGSALLQGRRLRLAGARGNAPGR